MTYLSSVSRTNTAASMKNINLDAASAAASESTHIFAFRAITDELGDSVIPDSQAGARSRHLHHTVKAPSRGEADDEEEDGCITSKQKVRRIVELLRVVCSDAGVFDIDDETSEGKTQFVTHETIQRYVSPSFFIIGALANLIASVICDDSLDEAKAMMPYFGELIEGLKRRLWL